MTIDQKTFRYHTYDKGFRNREATNEYFENKYPNTIELVSQRLKEELSPEKNVVWFHMHETIYKDIEQPKDRNADELKGYYQGKGYTVMLRDSNQCIPDMFYNGFWLKVK